MPYNWSIRTKRRLVPNLATPRNVTRQRDHRFAFSGCGGKGDGRGLSRSLRGQGRKLATSAFSAKPYCCLSVSLLFLFISLGHCRRLLDCETFVEASVPRFPWKALGPGEIQPPPNQRRRRRQLRIDTEERTVSRAESRDSIARTFIFARYELRSCLEDATRTLLAGCDIVYSGGWTSCSMDSCRRTYFYD